jgi:hypothetical protein
MRTAPTNVLFPQHPPRRVGGVMVTAMTTMMAVLLAAGAAGCGGDDATGATATEVAAGDPPVPSAPAAALPAPTSSPSADSTTTTPTTAAEPATSTTLPSDTTVPATDVPSLGDISVVVGVDSSPTRVAKVPVGTEVTLTIANPSAADEFHVHGYDLGDGREVPAGTTATFTFLVDKLGTYELESHATGDVLLLISVY